MEMAYIVEWQLQFIKNEMKDYVYPSNKKNRATKLDDLLIEEGGQPLRSVILSSWQSGDDFVGGILSAYPSNFYISKPFAHLKQKLYKNSSQSNKALDTLEWMFRCDYWNLTEYLSSTERRLQILKSNIYLKKQCKWHENICWNELFLSQFCRQFPFQTINVNQLSLKLTERFFKEKTLEVKVALIIRDPREVMLSRKKHDKCLGDAHCFDPSILCYDMVEDYRAAVRFSKHYPDSFRILRYEDLMLDPHNRTEELLKFYGLHSHDYVQSYLEIRARSKDARSHWPRELKFEEVDSIQRHCKLAMRLWGYVPAKNPYGMKNLNPITDYFLDYTYE